MDWPPNACSCGGPARPLYPVRDLNFAATPATGDMMRCEACGSRFPDRFPGPADLEPAYQDYYTARPSRGGWRGVARGIVDRSRRGYLARDTPGDAVRVLDYGCGAGTFLTALSRSRPGVAAFGTDVGAHPATTDGFTWLTPDEVARQAPYDWITLGHVLEHLADPAAVLARLAALLAPGGGLWIATPNADGYLFAAAGPFARDNDFPRHREIFTRRGLARLAEAIGLETTFLAPPPVNALFNAASCLSNIGRDRQASGAVRAKAAARVIAAAAAHLVVEAAGRDEGSPELVAVCRPR